MKRVLSLTLALVMLLSCVAVLTACPPAVVEPESEVIHGCDNPVDENGDFLCENCGLPVKKEGNYTYNTYTSVFPTKWNPHTYETDADSTIPGYCEVGFYTFDYNEAKDGFVIVPEMAAEMPIDVTADYVGDEWEIDEDETARAWKIVLRDDLRWENGTPITANDFVESAKRLLNPKAINRRADSLYAGNLKVAGAKDYFYGGRTVISAAANEYTEYSTELDASLIFSLAPPSADNNNQECAMRTMMGFPSSYDRAACANYLISNYGDDMPAFTADAAEKMEGKTLAEIKADAVLAEAWTQLLGWWQTEPNEELHFFLTNVTCDVTEWETVGIKAVSDTEIVIILEDSLTGFYLNYALGTSLGLVYLPMYDACESVDADGMYSNTYGTTADTYMSFGPYKLTYFELDKQIIIEANPYWYGYYDADRAGQFQTTKIVIDWINDPETAMQAFLQGKLDGKGLDVDYVSEYTGSSRIYYTDGDSTWFIATNPNDAAFAEWEAANEGFDKSIITVKEFRMALSFALDRADFIATLDPTGSKASGLFSSMICSNPDLGIMYREEEAAKDAVLKFWGISQDDIGEGKLYPNKDEAIASITGYNLEGAKALFDQAYDAAVEAGIYDGQEKIQLCIGTPNNTSKFYTNGYTFLVDCWTNAMVGTKLEGKVEFTNDHTLGNKFADALRANKVDILFGVGWTGSALDPYGLIDAYTTSTSRYAAAWNTESVYMDFVVDGETYRASVADWTKAIQGGKVEIQAVDADGSLVPGETMTYSCGTNDNRPEERILLLAALEGIVLEQYHMIPTHNDSSASLLGYQVEYYTQEYVYGLGRGGIQYMTYNYTDEEWNAYVASEGGTLDYHQ